MSDRGQAVLAAAVLVAAALVPMLVAYHQLGYPGDAAAESAAREPSELADARRHLDRATHEAASAAAGTAWRNRTGAATTLNRTFRNATTALERHGARRDVRYDVTYNRTVAERLARRSCPRGDHRRFGSCRAVDGFVVQHRNRTVATVAVAVDLTVDSPRGRTTATLVLRPYR